MQSERKTIARQRILRLGALVLAAISPAGRFCLGAAVPEAPAVHSPAEFIPERYAQVTVAPAHTSAYLARISLAMPPLEHHGDAYTASYSVKVFPFFMFNEHGQISIEFSGSQLQQLERGQPVEFTGYARNSRGAARRIDGRAVPAGPGGDHGKIKVRVWVSKNIDVVFNTTYRFTGKE